MRILALASLSVLASPYALAAAQPGIVVTDVSHVTQIGTAQVAAQGDRLLVARGETGEGPTHLVTHGPLVIRRMSLDGSEDTQFKRTEIALNGTGATGTDDAAAIVVLRSGHAVAAWVSHNEDQSTQIGVAKALPDGGLDRSFGGRGYLRLDFSGGTPGNHRVLSLKADSSQRILLAYSLCRPDSMNMETNCTFQAVRILPSGRMDPSFGTHGVLTLPPPATAETIEGSYVGLTLLPRPQGGLLVGESIPSSTHGQDFRLMALSDQGALLPGYHSGEKFLGDSSQHCFVSGFQALEYGQTLLAGFCGDGTVTMTRLSPRGEVDPSFGAQGRFNGPNFGTFVASLQDLGDGNGEQCVDGAQPSGGILQIMPDHNIVFAAPYAQWDAGEADPGNCVRRSVGLGMVTVSAAGQLLGEQRSPVQADFSKIASRLEFLDVLPGNRFVGGIYTIPLGPFSPAPARWSWVQFPEQP